MNEQYKGQERRQFKRSRVNFIITYRVNRPPEVIMVVGHKEIHAIMLDLSEAGLAILTRYNLPVSAILLMKFTLINPHAFGDSRIRRMEILGEVRNNSLIQEKERRIGILFIQIDKEDKQAIANFVKFSFNR